MIVDSSAVVAILTNEPEGRQFAGILLAAPIVRISTATYVELVNVIAKRIGRSALTDLDDFLEKAEVELEPFTIAQAQWARHACVTYGKHGKKGLNFGDCFSYALAKETGEPLLFKGHDFTLTDISPAI